MRGRRLVTTERLIAIASDQDAAVVDELRVWASDNGLELAVVGVGEPIPSELFDGTMTVGVTIGGDGTFLEGIKQFAPREIPILGVDTGTHPFLVRIPPADLEDALHEVIRGHATIETRSQFHVRVDNLDVTGLNDVVLEFQEPKRPVDRKITSFDVFVDDDYVGTYRGTGIAVSTATGSTGISMSAGGPIHLPGNNETLQITPLLTHDLSVRPIVVDGGLTITLVPADGVDLSIDGGRHYRTVDADTAVSVGVADTSAQIINTSTETGYFQALHERLGWNLYRTPPPEPPTTILPQATPDGLLERALAVAKEAARSVGGPLRELHGRTESVEYKTDKADLVTEADYQSERIITSIIESEFPGHNIHSEEDVHHESGSTYTWLIDPLDGTGNYANGNPNYSVSIALIEEDRPVVGVVYAPETDELFSAIEGQPAYANSTEITTTDRNRLDESVFMSGYDPDGTFLSHFYNETRGVRRLGSVALHLCYLASGSCDATWEYDTLPWDTAAGVVIARASGATITDAAGEPYSIYKADDERNELIGTNGPLHEAVLEHLRTHEDLSNL